MAPAYRIGHVWADTPTRIEMNLAIGRQDFAPARLICLVNSVKQRYSDREEISVMIFDSIVAAKRFISPIRGDSVGKPQPDWPEHLHAHYLFKSNSPKENVALLPVGANRLFETRIELPVTSVPVCRLNVSGRCLLALDRVRYPAGPWKAGRSGSVVLTGVVRRDGRMARVRVGEPGNPADELARAAALNLNSWYFEAAQEETPVRIRFDYTIDPAVTLGNRPVVQFHLPDRVEICETPLK